MKYVVRYAIWYHLYNLYTNLQVADNSSTTEFILSCFQGVPLHQRVENKDMIHHGCV